MKSNDLQKWRDKGTSFSFGYSSFSRRAILQCMLLCRRHRELEQKLIQDAANKRIEELVNKRVEEELEKRKEEIEAEVARRIEEAKKVMEKEMMEELERRRQQLLEEEKKREVQTISIVFNCLIRENYVS